MHALLTIVALWGCGDSAPPPPAQPSAPAAAPAPPSPAAAPIEPAQAQPDEPAPTPNAGVPQTLPASAPQRIRARHLVIAWQGTIGARPTLRRSRQDAWKIAQQAQQQIRDGRPFDEVTRELSDGPSAPRGGELGAFERGAMDETFEKAAFSLGVGEISDIVETPFGFHIIQREALVEVHVAEVLVQWAGLKRTASQRSQEEALRRAQRAVARLQAGDSIQTVAHELSDGPARDRGGDLGWFQRGQLMPAIDTAAFALKPGQVSDIVESPLGYHVLVRLE